MTVEVIVTLSEATADEAFRAARSVRGYPLCGHREWSEDGKFLDTCVRARGHDSGVHDSP